MRLWHLTEWQWLKTILLMWAVVIAFNPGAVEGWLFPVSAPMQLSWVSPADDDSSNVWGISARLRPSCSFRRIDWYLGRRTEDSSPAKVDTGKPITRKVGSFVFGPWHVFIPVGDLAFNSYADVFHSCRYFGIPSPWLTKSRFWN